MRNLLLCLVFAAATLSTISTSEAQEAKVGLLCNQVSEVVAIVGNANQGAALIEVNAEETVCGRLVYIGVVGDVQHTLINADGTVEIRQILVLGISPDQGRTFVPLLNPQMQYGPFLVKAKPASIGV